MLLSLELNFTTITIYFFLILGVIFWIAVAIACSKESDDYMHDYFGVPKKYSLPDEIKIEIIQEISKTSEASSESPAEHSSQLSTIPDHLSSASVVPSSPKGTGAYLPE